MSGTILDLILLVIFLICIIRAWKKGFLKVGASILSSLSGFIIGVITSSVLAQSIYEFFNVKVKLYNFISPRVTAMLSDTSSKLTDNAVHSLFSEMPIVGNYIYRNLASTGKLQSALDSVINVDQITNSIVNLTEPIILTLFRILIFMIVAFVAKLLLKGIFTVVFGIIFKVPLISSLDSVLGAVFGIVSGAFWCVVVIFVLMLVSVVATNGFVTSATFNGSKIVTAMFSLLGMK